MVDELHTVRGLIERLSRLWLTVTGDKIGEVEIEFPDGDVDVIGVDAETRLSAFRSLLQPFPVRRLQRNCLEEDHHYQVQPPYLRYNDGTAIIGCDVAGNRGTTRPPFPPS